MPLPEGLLKPIPGQNSSGQSLRYDSVYDRIREARREEEVLSAGVWTRETKKADFVQVVKLATEALSSKSKDIQIAVWLTEALLVREGIPGLTQGLDLIRGLLESFWDTLYPEIEDGDLEMRVAPVAWVGSRLDAVVRKVPLTKSKLDWLKYQESRRVGYEADAAGNEAKMAARLVAIEEKKCTGEQFDDAVKLTGDAYYQQMTADLTAALDSLQALDSVCESKFARDAPNFSHLRVAIEDLQDTIRQFWKPLEIGEPPVVADEPLGGGLVESRVLTSTTTPQTQKAVSEQPAGFDDATHRVVDLARFLRLENATSPVPYLVLRAVRWGELRAKGHSLDTALLESPPRETRQVLKKLATEGQWGELLEAAEVAMGSPCGRGWLDLQRHTVRACEGLGYEAAATAVRVELRTLLADYPDLLSASLSDDTPAANNETQAWIRENILPPVATTPGPAALPPSDMAFSNTIKNNNHAAAPDIEELAQQAASAGRIQDAVELLSRAINEERSGRARFQRKVQLAALCLSTKHEAIACPILAELVEEIDRRKLEEWEESTALAHPMALLFRCMGKLGYDEAAKQRIYQKICRLDPVQALSSMR
jgi:type VI secretion system protein ImpA